MSPNELDRVRITHALDLAASVVGNTEPNPRVGCVLGDGSGAVFGTGATQQAGGAHAEIMALREARAHGFDLKGATAWVTLEPCAHHGRTPPCCDAFIAAGLGRVVIAVHDPFPQVAGKGIASLRAAGIQVDMAELDQRQTAWELNIGFFSRVLRGRPWIRVKVAASLDGRTALDNGSSQWITSEEARADGHAWRKRASGILTGIGTVLADDPRLDVRLVPASSQPLRIVVDSTLRLPLAARLLDPPGSVIVATARPLGAAIAQLKRRGVEVILLAGDDGRVDLQALARELGRRGVNELHVEGGAVLTTSMLQSRLADELLLYLAPRLLGGQRGMVEWGQLDKIEDGFDLSLLEAVRIGVDLRLRLRPPGLGFLPTA